MDEEFLRECKKAFLDDTPSNYALKILSSKEEYESAFLKFSTGNISDSEHLKTITEIVNNITSGKIRDEIKFIAALNSLLINIYGVPILYGIKLDTETLFKILVKQQKEPLDEKEKHIFRMLRDGKLTEIMEDIEKITGQQLTQKDQIKKLNYILSTKIEEKLIRLFVKVENDYKLIERILNLSVGEISIFLSDPDSVKIIKTNETVKSGKNLIISSNITLDPINNSNLTVIGTNTQTELPNGRIFENITLNITGLVINANKIHFKNSKININNSVINGKDTGLFLENCKVQINNCTIKATNQGIYSKDSALKIKDSTIKSEEDGIIIEGSGNPILENVKFDVNLNHILRV